MPKGFASLLLAAADVSGKRPATPEQRAVLSQGFPEIYKNFKAPVPVDTTKNVYQLTGVPNTESNPASDFPNLKTAASKPLSKSQVSTATAAISKLRKKRVS